jgi:hypothetical protein
MAMDKIFEGEYIVRGKNSDESPYQGKATIRKEGDIYKINWSIAGDQFDDEGHLDGSTLRTDFWQAVYEVKADGTLEGTWSNGYYEKLTPLREVQRMAALHGF